MTDRTISPSGSPLRRRMTFLRPPKRASRRRVEDMEVRGFTPCTQRGYIAAVKDFTAFLGRSPDQGSAEDLRRHCQSKLA